jgi:hypothetical protein
MKTLALNFKTFAILALGVTMAIGTTGCKKKKKTAVQETPKPKGEVVIDEYCTGEKYFSDNKMFRASGVGESMDRNAAKKKARSNAQSELAKSIKSTMKIVGDNFISSNEFNNKEEITETFNEMARTIVDQELVGAKVICDKLTQREDKTFVSYMAIELSGGDLVSKYNETLSKDERIRAEYNYEKFKETFEKEMEKFGK